MLARVDRLLGGRYVDASLQEKVVQRALFDRDQVKIVLVTLIANETVAFGFFDYFFQGRLLEFAVRRAWVLLDEQMLVGEGVVVNLEARLVQGRIHFGVVVMRVGGR